MNLICARSLLALQQEGDLIYRGKLGDLYVRFEWIGLLLAAGASFALFTLEPVGKRKLSVAFYLFLLFLLSPTADERRFTRMNDRNREWTRMHTNRQAD